MQNLSLHRTFSDSNQRLGGEEDSSAERKTWQSYCSDPPPPQLKKEKVIKNKCNGAEWSKDRTQAAESIKWRPQQAYGSNEVLLSQPQTIFSTPKILTLTHR